VLEQITTTMDKINVLYDSVTANSDYKNLTPSFKKKLENYFDAHKVANIQMRGKGCDKV
jgi:hypothetical protein